MNSILKYKDALPFREDNYMTPKINHVTTLAIIKHHQGAGAQSKAENVAAVKKQREMKSDIGF